MTIRHVTFALALLAACKSKKTDEPAAAAGSAAPAANAVEPAGSAAPAPAAPGSAAPAVVEPLPPPGAPVAAGGALQNKADSANDVPCDQAARDVTGGAGTSWYMKCPAHCNGSGTVWGTDIYTDDSALCRAAVHAGAITASDGGTVLVTWAPSQPTYVGSERHGIATQDFNAWGRSFFVQRVDAGGQPVTPAPAMITEPLTAHVSCTMNASSLIGPTGTKWHVDCPANCPSVTVWGTDPFTDDSAVCSAAIFAGVIDRAAGGKLAVTIDGEQKEFTGSTNFGVTTNSFGPYSRTYHVAKP